MFVKGCTAERDQLQLPHAVLEGLSKFVATGLAIARCGLCMGEAGAGIWRDVKVGYGEM